MNLFEILKQFKTIEPDGSYAEKSKRAILAMPQKVTAGVRLGVLRFIETGVAVVLAGFFILLITGGLTGNQPFAPVQYSVVDPQGLKAEAQAVDMQIELANVTYTESTSSLAVGNGAASTPAGVSSTKGLAPAFVKATSSAPSASSSTATSTASSTTLSVDQALQKLSQ